jgi:hypothetical protein
MSNRTHDAVLRTRTGITLETAVRRILRTFDRATPADIEAGASWYGGAGALVEELARTASVTPAHAAAVVAQLSPRTTWSRNVAGATALLLRGPDSARALGCLGANVGRAVVALESSDPLSTINGPKTGAFARNILGDRDSVTVDVWAARIALSPGWSRGQDDHGADLSRQDVYDALAHAYRVAARRRGVDPTTCQATSWIVVRNGRAA